MYTRNLINSIDVLGLVAQFGAYEGGSRDYVSSQDLSKKYQEVFGVNSFSTIRHVIWMTKKKGLTDTKKGKNGVKLSRPPSEITFADILIATETFRNTERSLATILSQYTDENDMPNLNNPLIKNYFGLKSGYEALLNKLSQYTLEDHIKQIL